MFKGYFKPCGPEDAVPVPQSHLTKNQLLYKEVLDRIATAFENDPESFRYEPSSVSYGYPKYRRGNISIIQYSSTWCVEGYSSIDWELTDAFSARIRATLQRRQDEIERKKLMDLKRELDCNGL